MKNSFGDSVSVTLFGESHGKAIGAVIDGIAPGISIDEEYIKNKLSLRRPSGSISTTRVELDEFQILSGVFNGKTTGTPISIVIENKNTISKDYSSLIGVARPSHADYAANCKYHGFEDYRGGGHFSGRITAALVAAGAIFQKALEDKGIYIATHIKECGGVFDDDFNFSIEEINNLNNKNFAVINQNKKDKMTAKIEQAAKLGDSLGGILETQILGVPSGVGEPWFDSVESKLSHILFSVPAVKGVEFGLGFGFANKYGSEVNDSFYINNGNIKTKTNNNGGINGGITNGMPITFKSVIKPTPSIKLSQNTVNFNDKKETELVINGRHDPAIIHRARVVVDSVSAICIADLLTTRFGTDYLRKD